MLLPILSFGFHKNLLTQVYSILSLSPVETCICSTHGFTRQLRLVTDVARWAPMGMPQELPLPQTQQACMLCILCYTHALLVQTSDLLECA